MKNEAAYGALSQSFLPVHQKRRFSPQLGGKMISAQAKSPRREASGSRRGFDFLFDAEFVFSAGLCGGNSRCFADFSVQMAM